MRADQRLLDEIRSRLPVSEVVRRHVPNLKRDGKEWKALSPFGAEKTPSFTVNDQKGFYHDFSSGKHGDIFTFEMEVTGCSFPEALQKLAELAGVAMPEKGKRPAAKGNGASRRNTDGDQGLAERAENSAPGPGGQGDDPFDAEPSTGEDIPPNLGDEQRGPTRASGGRDSEYKRELFKTLGQPPAATYQYKDGDGIVRYERYRYEFQVAGKRQKFFLPRRVLDGEVIWGLDDQDYYRDDRGEWRKAGDKSRGEVRRYPRAERFPYRLPELLAAVEAEELVHLTEGEKDADRLAALGAVATCSEGAWPEEISGYFSRADVVQHLDNDVAGQRHGHRVGIAIRHVVKRHRVLEYPDLKPGGDVSDFLDAQPKQPLMALYKRIAAQSKPWALLRPASQYGGLTWEEIGHHVVAADFVVDDLILAGEATIIGGESGSGKTFFSTDLACHVATGREFFGKKVQQGLVIYQAGESAAGVQKRIQAWRRHYEVPETDKIPLVVLTRKIDLFNRDARDVAGLIQEIRAWQEYFIDVPLRVLVVDTLAKASVGAEENSAKDMGIVLDNLDQVREPFPQMAAMLPHHMNAEGKKLRGSTAIKANVEGVIAISVDSETKVRTVEVQKMKEQESGERFQFELMRVVLGQRDDGKPIDSCVVVARGEKAAARAGSEAGSEKDRDWRGYRLTKIQGAYFSMLLECLKRHGRAPPPALELPTAVREVCRYDEFKRLYGQKNPYDGPADNPEQREAWLGTLRQRLRSNREALRALGIVDVGEVQEKGEGEKAHAVGYIWWTGRPVAGFEETELKEPARRKRAQGQPDSNVVPFERPPGPGDDDERLPI